MDSNDIALLTFGESKIHAFVVVVDDSVQIREVSIVIEPAVEVRCERAKGRGAITPIGAAIGLKAVNANIVRCAASGDCR